MWEIRDQYIIDDTDGQVICCWGSYTTKRKARLIAAVPELLAALQAFMDDYDEGRFHMNGYSYEKARDAIKKAGRR